MRLLRGDGMGERMFATTADGWKIALWHRAGDGSRNHPVLLCHGLGANRFNLNAPGNNNVARFLQRAGFDCWSVELRGAGTSRHGRPPWSRRRWRAERSWSLDDYVHHDLPAAIKKIFQETGRNAVHWVGHSLGGMLSYSYLTRYDQRAVKSVVAIASPCNVVKRDPLIAKLVYLEPIVRRLPKLPQRAVLKALSPLAGNTPDLIARFFFDPGSIEPRLLRQMACLALSDLSPQLIAEFLVWYRDGSYTDPYGVTNYGALLEQIKVPFLLFAGSRDNLTPMTDLARVFENVGAPDKSLVVLSRANGFSHDYGHIDPVLGRDAPLEVFPRIRDWLIKHDAGTTHGARRFRV